MNLQELDKEQRKLYEKAWDKFNKNFKKSLPKYMKKNPARMMAMFSAKAVLYLECLEKYPLPFKWKANSQAGRLAYGLYHKIIFQFMITHKVRLYKGRISKTTLKAFRAWTFDGELQ